jgi:hypothetical protein
MVALAAAVLLLHALRFVQQVAKGALDHCVVVSVQLTLLCLLTLPY